MTVKYLTMKTSAFHELKKDVLKLSENFQFAIGEFKAVKGELKILKLVVLGIFAELAIKLFLG